MIHETFHSETIHAATNQPAIRKVVSIKNGKGYKLNERLTPKGKVVNRTRKILKPKEIRHIMNRRFLPGLWKDCGASARKKSRRNSRG